MIALCCWCDTVSVVIPAGNESARPAEGLPVPNSPADAVRNPAQVSFWLLEPVADAAMTYFYAQLFAMDTEIRAMFPAAMDVQRPAWWMATVTGIELRGPDIAVLTLQPEQPLNYLPGQHISVQTPHWPRLWRTYSIANAPRPDGSLRLHVRAVTDGLVSPVLVHQVRAGDPLVLGAPAGAMIADTQSNRDVLCLAGGTGLAPVKAIIEALISTPNPGRHREIVLDHGARRHQDLYDLAALQEMELLYPWLQVIPAVSDEPAHDHGTMYGTVPELAAKATWADREVYISGPDHMIVKTARVLRERGAPNRLIHYDLDPKASQGL
jgi:NAD(P)H-flavin reductase